MVKSQIWATSNAWLGFKGHRSKRRKALGGLVTAGQRKEQGLVNSLGDRGERAKMGSVGAGSCRQAVKQEIRVCPG